MSLGSQRRRGGAAGLFEVLIHLHVLHAASNSPVDTTRVVELLTQRGYQVRNRAISALLRRFERRGWLKARGTRPSAAPFFEITPKGKRALLDSKLFLSALMRDLSSAFSARRNKLS